MEAERTEDGADRGRGRASPTGTGHDAAGLPERVVVGTNGAYWRDFGDFYSMCPVSTDNDPIGVVAVYVRVPADDVPVAAPAPICPGCGRPVGECQADDVDESFEPPVAAPDHAETIRLVTERAAQEYGWAWIDQPWQDHMADFIGDKRAADFIRECDPKSVLALLAERQQHKDYLRDALHEMQLAQLDADNERRILGEVLAERQQLRDALEAADAELGKAPAMAVPHLVESFKRQVLRARKIISAALAGEEDAPRCETHTFVTTDKCGCGAAGEEDTTP